jgi:hypothetical protein
VYAEVILQFWLCHALLSISWFVPKLRGGKTWKRALFAWSGVFNVKLVCKTVPLLGASVKMHGDTKFEEDLRHVSFMYRLFYYGL